MIFKSIVLIKINIYLHLINIKLVLYYSNKYIYQNLAIFFSMKIQYNFLKKNFILRHIDRI